MTTLTFELVPQGSWGDNLRSHLQAGEWDKVRTITYRRAGYKCEVCGGVGPRHPVEAHEVWSYDDASHVQTLVRMIALCPTCHAVKHIGRIIAMENVQLIADVLAHAMFVNQWSESQVWAEIDKAFDEWEERSRWKWTLDISRLKELIA